MEKTETMHLDLRSPLFYDEAPELNPFDSRSGDDASKPEFLFCFELDKKQAEIFEPDLDSLLGKLIFSGRKSAGGGTLILPAGNYLFSQQKNKLCKKDILEMAIEQQKDSLWEKLKPGSCLYIRFLHEDGSQVTQIFRPYTS